MLHVAVSQLRVIEQSQLLQLEVFIHLPHISRMMHVPVSQKIPCALVFKSTVYLNLKPSLLSDSGWVCLL